MQHKILTFLTQWLEKSKNNFFFTINALYSKLGRFLFLPKKGMTENSNVNLSARKQRHSSVNFKEGMLYKNKVAHKKTLARFLFKISFLSLCFVLFSFASYELTSAYPETDEITPVIDFDLQASQVFVLGKNGFVTKPSAQTEEGDRSTSNEIIEYTVEPGDTIFGIAAKFSLRAQTVTDNNDGVSQWTILKPGKTLKILPVDGLLHEAQSKETIASLSTKYKVKKEDVLRQNKLEKNDKIEGLSLIIPGAKKVVVRAAVAPINAPSVYTGAVSGNFIWPANGSITQYYHRWHYALDIAHRNKGPIYASSNGVVIKAQGGWNGGYGNMVIIDHGNGFKTLYAHNEKLYVKVGDKVTQGQTIAWMGNTGRVRGKTGIHLHFELIYNGVKKNPLAYLGKR